MKTCEYIVMGLLPHQENWLEAKALLQGQHFSITSVCRLPDSSTMDPAVVREFPEPTSLEKAELTAIRHDLIGWHEGAGAFQVPGYGSFLAAGPLVDYLKHVESPSVGTMTGLLIQWGATEYDASCLVQAIVGGKFLIVIDCSNRATAEKIFSTLEQAGAEQLFCNQRQSEVA